MSTPHCPSVSRMILTITVLSLIFRHSGMAAEKPTEPTRELQSGLAPGETVPSFYVRAVTGPLKNRSVCYVCRNGDRPVVMLLFRQLTPGYRTLFNRVDTLTDNHRADGLRSFGVVMNQDVGDAISSVQTFAFNHKIEMPLTVTTPTIAKENLSLNNEAHLTVLLYTQGKVVSRFGYRADEFRGQDVETIAKSIQKLLAPGKSSSNASRRN